MKVQIASLLALLCACGSPATTEENHALSVPGEESSMAVVMGQGLNHIDWTPKGHCVTISGIRTQSGQTTGQFVEFRLLEVSSVSSLRESLDITAAASIRMGLFGRLSTRMNYAQSVNKNNNSRYLMIHVRVGNQLQLASDFTFTQEAQNLLRLGRHEDFLRHCGTEFVSGYRTGGEFFALFEFEFTQIEEEKRFSLAIDAAGTGWKVSSEINAELAKFDQNARVQLSMLRIGGSGPMPDVKDLKQFANQFPTLVSQVSAGFVTLELVTKDYGGVRPLDLKANPGLVVRQDQIINQIARNRDAAQELLNSIRYVKTHLANFAMEENSESELNRTEQALVVYLNAQNNAAVKCFEDIFTGCALPTIALPEVHLPQRKNGDCHFEFETICHRHGRDGSCLLSSIRRTKVCN